MLFFSPAVNRMLLIALCLIIGTSLLCAGNPSGYRGFRFGMNLPDAAKEAGLKPIDALTLHRQPDLIQEMEWRPRNLVLSDDSKADPVKSGMLCFRNGELFRIVISYDRFRVEGMTTDDLIEGISKTYGTPNRPTLDIPFHSVYGETATVLAQWQDAEHSANLIRTGDRAGYALILYARSADAAAQESILAAIRLENSEAPQRELDQQKKRDADERLVLDKARSVNRPNFRP